MQRTRQRHDLERGGRGRNAERGQPTGQQRFETHRARGGRRQDWDDHFEDERLEARVLIRCRISTAGILGAGIVRQWIRSAGIDRAARVEWRVVGHLRCNARIQLRSSWRR